MLRLHTKRGIRLGLAVGIELFLGFVLIAPFGGMVYTFRTHLKISPSELVQVVLQVS